MRWSHRYLEAVRALDLDVTGDRRATQILDRLAPESDINGLKAVIEGRSAIVYGCGPSLENDVNKLWGAGLCGRCVNVTADGAVKALMNYGLVPHVNVTDLDGDVEAIVAANGYGCATVVHAHAGNIRELVSVVPRLGGRVYATTQSEPTAKVHNFGGYSDGDRAVYLAEHFRPKHIILAGMDFGSVIGVFSGKYDPIRKPRRLRHDKLMIEELAARSRVAMYNVTSSGENIRRVHHMSVDRLAHAV